MAKVDTGDMDLEGQEVELESSYEGFFIKRLTDTVNSALSDMKGIKDLDTQLSGAKEIDFAFSKGILTISVTDNKAKKWAIQLTLKENK